MKKKDKKTISTLLGPDSTIEGTIEFSGIIILNGYVKGKIYGNGGTLIIGEQARIEADIVVDEAEISGEVVGTINAKERIQVLSTGKVIGDIQAPVISIDPGAVFNGSCGMRSQQTLIPEKTKNNSDADKEDVKINTKF